MSAISSAYIGTVEALTEKIPIDFLFAKTGFLEKLLKVTVVRACKRVSRRP